MKQHICSEKLDMYLGQLLVTTHLCTSPPCYTVELPSQSLAVRNVIVGLPVLSEPEAVYMREQLRCYAQF